MRFCLPPGYRVLTLSSHLLLLQEFYQIACSDSKAITRFHLEANKDDTVIVTDWDPNKKSRVVSFTLDMAIPAALKRFVGEFERSPPGRLLNQLPYDSITVSW